MRTAHTMFLPVFLGFVTLAPLAARGDDSNPVRSNASAADFDEGRVAGPTQTAPLPEATPDALRSLSFPEGRHVLAAGDLAHQTPDEARTAFTLETQIARVRGVQWSAVTVHLVDGAATLLGAVPTQAAREEVDFVVASNPDVHVVRDELTVSPAAASARGGGPADDAAIQREVSSALARVQGLGGHAPRVSVSNGVVRLEGHVPTYLVGRRVLATVKATQVVRGLDPNGLEVNEATVINVGDGTTPVLRGGILGSTLEGRER